MTAVWVDTSQVTNIDELQKKKRLQRILQNNNHMVHSSLYVSAFAEG